MSLDDLLTISTKCNKKVSAPGADTFFSPGDMVQWQNHTGGRRHSADRIFKDNCREILTHGVWDTDQNVRPHWEDGTPAHGEEIRHHQPLRPEGEFPFFTIRRTYFKTCIDELLWIWQQKSNNIHDLRGHIWDSWADESGSIGKAYGYQLAVKHRYPEEMDQVDRVLYDLKHNPASRRILTNIYNFQDLHEMALYPAPTP